MRMTNTAADSPVAAPPHAIQATRGLLVLVALYHLAFPLLELLQTHLAGVKLAQSVGQNAFLLVLTAVLVCKLPSGHRWVRRPATFSQVLTIVTGALMWPAASDLVTTVLAIDAVSVTIIILLWVPSSSRQLFARSRRHSTVHRPGRASFEPS
jgi:NADH:ubiquinone oxidoreductase subunit 2 (subunit N)